MIPTDIIRVGDALYGERWHSALARDLNVTYRTMNNWIAGRTAIPSSVPGQCWVLLKARQEKIERVLTFVAQDG